MLFRSAIAAATGAYLTNAILSTIISYLGGLVTDGLITKGAHGYFSGTQYDYNVKATDPATNRYKTYTGRAFDGRYRTGSSAWQTGKAYEGYYPQFIRERDNSVATWLFYDFFSGTHDVYRWSSLI